MLFIISNYTQVYSVKKITICHSRMKESMVCLFMLEQFITTENISMIILKNVKYNKNKLLSYVGDIKVKLCQAYFRVFGKTHRRSTFELIKG